MKNSSVWNIITVYKINSIFVKYFLLIFITFVIPLSGISIAVYFYIESNNDKEVRYAYEQSLLKISDTLDMVFDDVAKLSVRLSMDNEIISLLSDNNEISSYDLKLLIQSIITKINIPTSQYVNSILLYSRENNYIVSSSGYYSQISDFSDRGWHESYMKLVPGIANIVQYRLATIETGANSTTKSYITSIQAVPINSFQNFGAVVINVDLNRFDRFISGEYTNNVEDVYVIDKNNTVMYNKSNRYIGYSVDKINFLKGISLETGLSSIMPIDGKRKLIVHKKSKLTGYSYISVVSIDNESMAASMRNLLISFLLIGVLFSAFLALIVSINLYKPFGDIISIINHQNQGDQPKFINKKTRFYELKYIFTMLSSFNSKKTDMEMNLSNSLTMLKKSQTIALQAQINPHFLYNTLNAIKWMVMEYTHGENEASKAITTLAQLLRLSLETKENLIDIRTEIEHSMKYISIEKLRFEDMFEVVWDIPAEIMDFLIVKITLQPIIENAIYHGIKQKKDKGIIFIRAEITENVVKIEVEDNGVGLKEDELEYLNNELQSENINEDSKIGLKNVSQRIKLIFGENYGVKLFSQRNEGTIVKIVIPKVK